MEVCASRMCRLIQVLPGPLLGDTMGKGAVLTGFGGDGKEALNCV
jgi:hypothetical protein